MLMHVSRFLAYVSDHLLKDTMLQLVVKQYSDPLPDCLSHLLCNSPDPLLPSLLRFLQIIWSICCTDHCLKIKMHHHKEHQRSKINNLPMKALFRSKELLYPHSHTMGQTHHQTGSLLSLQTQKLMHHL